MDCGQKWTLMESGRGRKWTFCGRRSKDVGGGAWAMYGTIRQAEARATYCKPKLVLRTVSIPSKRNWPAEPFWAILSARDSAFWLPISGSDGFRDA